MPFFNLGFVFLLLFVIFPANDRTTTQTSNDGWGVGGRCVVLYINIYIYVYIVCVFCTQSLKAAVLPSRIVCWLFLLLRVDRCLYADRRGKPPAKIRARSFSGEMRCFFYFVLCPSLSRLYIDDIARYAKNIYQGIYILMNCIEIHHASGPYNASECGATGLHGTCRSLFYLPVTSKSTFVVVIPRPFFFFFFSCYA